LLSRLANEKLLYVSDRVYGMSTVRILRNDVSTAKIHGSLLTQIILSSLNALEHSDICRGETSHIKEEMEILSCRVMYVCKCIANVKMLWPESKRNCNICRLIRAPGWKVMAETIQSNLNRGLSGKVVRLGCYGFRRRRVKRGQDLADKNAI
jgi:hypothetical protein